jgi:hypothetical protein
VLCSNRVRDIGHAEWEISLVSTVTSSKLADYALN